MKIFFSSIPYVQINMHKLFIKTFDLKTRTEKTVNFELMFLNRLFQKCFHFAWKSSFENGNFRAKAQPQQKQSAQSEALTQIVALKLR